MSSSNTDAQKWVWPPSGDERPPQKVTANFGPVNKGDTMVIQWTPETNPVIQMTCTSISGVSSEHWVSSRPAKTPYSFTLLETADTKTADEQIFCHMWFHNSSMGNTVRWDYNNTARAKAVTFSGSGLSVTTLTDSSSSSTTTSMGSSSSSPPTGTNALTPSSSPSASPSSASSASSISSTSQPTSQTASSSGLTAGAKAGIGVGVALGGLGFLLGALALFFILRKNRKRKEQHPHELPPNERNIAEKEAPHTPVAVPQAYPAELPGSYGGHELDGGGRRGQPD